MAVCAERAGGRGAVMRAVAAKQTMAVARRGRLQRGQKRQWSAALRSEREAASAGAGGGDSRGSVGRGAGPLPGRRSALAASCSGPLAHQRSPEGGQAGSGSSSNLCALLSPPEALESSCWEQAGPGGGHRRAAARSALEFRWGAAQLLHSAAISCETLGSTGQGEAQCSEWQLLPPPPLMQLAGSGRAAVCAQRKMITPSC